VPAVPDASREPGGGGQPRGARSQHAGQDPTADMGQRARSGGAHVEHGPHACDSGGGCEAERLIERPCVLPRVERGIQWHAVREVRAGRQETAGDYAVHAACTGAGRDCRWVREHARGEERT
jgi:hypothetical protein